MKLVTVTLSLILLISCNSQEKNTNSENNSNKSTEKEVEHSQKTNTAKDISAEECKSLIDQNLAKLIDVRTPEEFENGTIETAQNSNFLDDQFLENIMEINKDQPIIVFCQAGGRSSKAMKALKDNGFKTVYNLIGGYGNWPY